MRLLKVVLGCFLVFAVSGAADAVNTATIKQDTYYRVQQDFRKCVSPLCGGFFITALNNREMKCSDGSSSKSCYVAKIDWHDTGLDQDQIKEIEAATSNGRVIVLGRTAPLRDPYFDDLLLLDAAAAWLSANDIEPEGLFFRVEDTGIRCITTPCFSLLANLLNRDRTRVVKLSELDLSGVGALPEQLKEARIALADGSLLVAGKLSKKAYRTRYGITLTASQFYLPAEPVECKVDEDCTLSPYLAPVAGPDECYCIICNGGPISVDEAMSNEKEWIEHCEKERLICPLYRCTAPEPVGCVQNRCEFLR